MTFTRRRTVPDGKSQRLLHFCTSRVEQPPSLRVLSEYKRRSARRCFGMRRLPGIIFRLLFRDYEFSRGLFCVRQALKVRSRNSIECQAADTSHNTA